MRVGGPASERRRLLGICAALGAVFLLALAASGLFATRLDGLAQTGARQLNTGWTYLRNGSYVPLPALPCTLEAPGEQLLLQHALTERELDLENVLTLRTRYASVRVWADERLVYEAAQGAEHALGSMWHFIPMDRCAGAGLLTVELRAYDGGGSWALERVLLDSPGAVQDCLLRENAGPLFFSAVCLLLTLALLFCAAVLARWRSRTHAPLLALALFVFLSGLWILLDSKVNTIWGGNFALSYFLSYAAFYLLLVPYLMYIPLMLRRGRRSLRVLIWALLVNAGVCMALHMAGLVELRRTAVLVHALIVLSIPFSVRAFWDSVVRRRERQLLFTFLGTLAIYACGLVSIVLYYLGWLRMSNNTPLYILGLSILLACMTADALASFGRFWRQKESSERYRRLALVDSMTELGNRNAYQLHMAQLLDHPPQQLALVTFDVDALKQINDQMGHHAGDQAICTAARCIQSVFGGLGSCYRVGGDEFEVVITGESVSEIPARLPRFLREVELRWEARPTSSGVSCGWASISFTPDAPPTPDQLYRLREQADQQMYHMKQARREDKPPAGPEG